MGPGSSNTPRSGWRTSGGERQARRHAHAAAELRGELRPEPVVAAEDLHGRHRDDRPAEQRIDVALPDLRPRPAPATRPSISVVSQLCCAGVRPVDLRLEVAAVDRDRRRRHPALDRGDAEAARPNRASPPPAPRAVRPIAFGIRLIWRLMMRTSTESRGVAHRLQRDARRRRAPCRSPRSASSAAAGIVHPGGAPVGVRRPRVDRHRAGAEVLRRQRLVRVAGDHDVEAHRRSRTCSSRRA